MPEIKRLQKNIRVVVVEDHPMFRDGITTRLKMEEDIDLVGDYADGGEALKAIRELKPDVAVMDVNLPTLNGLQVVKHVTRENLPTRAVVITAHHDVQQTLHVIRAGANAYAAKDIASDDLIKIIRTIAEGNFVINGQVMDSDARDRWISEQIEDLSVQTLDSGEEYYTPLSPREMQILTFVTHGKSNKEIAQGLNISQQTVKNHMTSILRKLNVEDRTQAAITAIRHGWVRIQK
ncbi:MAG: response regulator transcription factor [Chloroflexota bacterium]